MRFSRLAIIACLTAASLLSACQRDTGPDALKVTSRIFVFNYRLASATYRVTLEKTQPLPDGSTVAATFENPSGAAPLTLERPIFPRLDRIVLESPDVTCVRKERPYTVTIAVKGPDGAVLQTIETTVTSTLDQTILPARPLVVGPAYEKNPDMFRDGKVPAHFETAACAG